MRSPLYLRQLKRDLDHWIAEGLIDAHAAQNMWDEAGQRASAYSLPTILSVLGALLLGLAALSFVAANFWGIPKIFQLSILFGAMVISYILSWWCLHSGRAGAGQAAILLGVALFGVNIMLIAQIYHINAHYPDGVLAWALGALLAAILVPSRTALTAAFILSCVWTGVETLEFNVTLHWQFLLFWGSAFLVAQIMRWRLGFHLAVLSIIFWLTINTGNIADHFNWSLGEISSLYAVLWLGLWAKGKVVAALGYPYADAMEHYGIILFFGASFVLFFMAPEDIGHLAMAWRWTMAILTALALILGLIAWGLKHLQRSDIMGFVGTLAALIAFPYVMSQLLTDQSAYVWTIWIYRGIFLTVTTWLLSLGIRHDDHFIINVSFIAFGIEILLIYVDTFDTLLNQSAFFAIGGVLLIIVSMGLDRLRRRLTFRNDEEGTAL